MSPTKLELLTAWIPSQPWYLGGGAPCLSRGGGFRLDDPAGEVGIELTVVSDTGDASSIHYLVPMSYRAAPRPDATDALIGTSEHGILETRWIYDGMNDPVVRAQVRALVRGEALAQAQQQSNSVDLTVLVGISPDVEPALVRVLAPGVGELSPGSISAPWSVGELQTRGYLTAS
jgi:hypothetical protein